jgi:hypothetical protein
VNLGTEDGERLRDAPATTWGCAGSLGARIALQHTPDAVTHAVLVGVTLIYMAKKGAHEAYLSPSASFEWAF